MTSHATREPAIEVSRDGPYRVIGGIALVDGNGQDVVRNEGASREHYALCRCGHSQNKPFCSGMHWYVEFRDPVQAADHEPTIFEWAGGLPALTRMTRRFYEKYVPEDSLLAPLFATMTPRTARNRSCQSPCRCRDGWSLPHDLTLRFPGRWRHSSTRTCYNMKGSGLLPEHRMQSSCSPRLIYRQ